MKNGNKNRSVPFIFLFSVLLVIYYCLLCMHFSLSFFLSLWRLSFSAIQAVVWKVEKIQRLEGQIRCL